MLDITASDSYVYFAPVEGHLVSRFGSGSRTTTASPIGYVRDPKTGKPTLVEGIVVRIPGAEARRFLVEYSRAVDDGALVLKHENDYVAWQDAQRARAEAAATPPAPPVDTPAPPDAPPVAPADAPVP